MAASLASGCEVVNSVLNPLFNNANDSDLAMYTRCNIHLGNRLNTVSTLRVASSNIQLNNDLSTNGYMTTNGVQINKRFASDVPYNTTLTTTLSGLITNTSSNCQYSLRTGQSNFVFANSNNSQIASVNSNGDLQIAGRYAVSNYGMNAIQIFSNFTNGGSATSYNNIASSSFTVASGTKILMIHASLWSVAIENDSITYTLRQQPSNAVQFQDTMFHYINTVGTHMGFSKTLYLTNSQLPAGTYTFTATVGGTNVRVDFNDYLTVALVELPV
jgi:hypothetical protein